MKMPGIRKLPSRDKYSIQREKKIGYQVDFNHAMRGDPKLCKHLKIANIEYNNRNKEFSEKKNCILKAS